MKPQTVMKLASFTRRFDRYDHPISYRLVRTLLKRIYKKDEIHSPFEAVVPYDEGLINVDTRLLAEYKLFFFNRYEKAIGDLVRSLVKPGDVCIDVGANIGAITLKLAFAAGLDGRVFAVEPHPRMVDRLRANIELNGLRNISVIPYALSERTGTACLYAAESDYFHQGRSSLESSDGLTNKISIEKITGKILEKQITKRPVKFLKIDVEGHDFIVLKELAAVIETDRPFLVFEYAKKRWLEHGCRIEEAIDLLSEFRYRLYYIKHDMIFPFAAAVPDSCDVFAVAKSLE
jgi:FkbM family methyltransferase